ncbi:DHHC palmitoyltransferase [Musa troglodytarum]|uniref:S-acyltransferase n=1 Tax=Musa troglodytarum TaxID=320322 RepID=A0A9E7KEX5_9LILI|nr:DHHC palmitoyltransferase [Musa troglodytarum]
MSYGWERNKKAHTIPVQIRSNSNELLQVLEIGLGFQRYRLGNLNIIAKTFTYFLASSMQKQIREENYVSLMLEDHKTTCWGCGLHLVLESYSPIFKCGWCGAITDQCKTLRKPDSTGVWAVYPAVFSISKFCGIFHCLLTSVLSIITVSSFCLAAFRSAGAPANIPWGSYPIVEKDGLENYTYCAYCSKPKPPRAHHCRSCRMCVLDMDHHCPFIGNCVGAANHRYFIAFLISVVISCAYVFLMTLYAGFHVWPPLEIRNLALSGFGIGSAASIVKEIVAALASSALLLSARGLILIYLSFASLSVEIGLVVLLWQQLYWIYEGNTYINQIASHNVARGEKGWQNLLRFFSCPYSVYRVLLGTGNAGKVQNKC